MADEPRSHRIRFSRRVWCGSPTLPVWSSSSRWQWRLPRSDSVRTRLERAPLAFGHVLVMGAVVIAILGIVAYGPEGFLAALWVFVPLVPALAAIVSVAIYLLSPNDPSQPSAAGGADGRRLRRRRRNPLRMGALGLPRCRDGVPGPRPAARLQRPAPTVLRLACSRRFGVLEARAWQHEGGSRGAEPDRRRRARAHRRRERGPRHSVGCSRPAIPASPGSSIGWRRPCSPSKTHRRSLVTPFMTT